MDNRYRVNAASVFSLQYHLVWCPKYRKRILVDTLEKRLRELLYRRAKEIKTEIHGVKIMPDHVHRFVESDPTMAPARLAAHSSRDSPATNFEKSFRGSSRICRVCSLGATTSAASVLSRKQQLKGILRTKH